MVPARSSIDSKFGAGQQVVIARELVGIGREQACVVEVPLALHSGAAVGVPCSDAKGDAIIQRNTDVSTHQGIGIIVIVALAVGVELIAEEVVVEDAARAGQ